MTMQEIFDTLKPLGCVSLYRTGSKVNPYIKNPRDEEYYAVFDTWEHAKNARPIYNVHFISSPFNFTRPVIWGYLFHYINNSEHLGEDFVFPEKKLTDLVGLAKYKKEQYKVSNICKQFYHIAMIDAINKYGYDDIPENVAQYINEIHDLVHGYDEEIK